MKFKHIVFTVLALALCLGSTAQADWADDFESYALGSGLHGQGGWEGWDGNPAADAYVSNAYALSGSQSVEITPTSDIVQTFAETSGLWVMTGWCFIPNGSTGQQYFILLNTYVVPGNFVWSLNMLFDSGTGLVSTVEGGATTSIVYNQWVEVRVEIDLDNDLQTVFYNGNFLDLFGWSGSGVTEIAALDLFSDGGSSIYWDDCSLAAQVTATQKSTWSSIKASFR